MEIQDRRHSRRINLSEPVRLQLSDPSHFYGCLARNVSRSGLQLTVHEFIPRDTTVDLTIQLGPQRVVQRQGRVIWTDQLAHMDRYLCGIHFDERLS